MTAGARLRELLEGDEVLVAPGVFDGISATLAGHLGFQAAYMTGAGVSASGWGLPDIGLLTQTEMLERARTLAGILDIPLIADADTGYGSPLNVVRTVREYEKAGVAAVQLEDQEFPKRCGHLTGKEVIDADQFATKLTAALEARRDPSLVIIARTDAREPLGLDEAISRARLYAATGADMIFVEAPRSVEEIQRIADEVNAPLLLNVVEGGKTPEVSRSQLREMGYRLTIHPGAALGAATLAMLDSLGKLREAAALTTPTVSPAGFFELFGLEAWNELGNRYRD